MATSQANMAPPAASNATAPTGFLESLEFAKPRQFAWKTVLLAVVTVALVPVVLWKHALAAQIYLGALVAIHLIGLVVFARGVQKKDIAPTPFGLFWRVTGLAVMVAFLATIRLVPDSPWFWPSLAGIWVAHTLGLALLHVRAKDGAACPFIPSAWMKQG